MDIHQRKEQKQMNANGFREEELVSRRVKVGNDWQTRTFPVVGGRLRILHENNDNLSIQTEIIRLDSDFAVVKAAVESQKGKFNGTGTASVQRDARLADSLVELAETRAIARALRFGVIGVEYMGAEEVSHVPAAEQEREPPPSLRDVLSMALRRAQPSVLCRHVSAVRPLVSVQPQRYLFCGLRYLS
jgi:hypothetical protein